MTHPTCAGTCPTQAGFPNYDLYAEYTRQADWESVCALNGVKLDAFGARKELKVLPRYLEAGEVVFALSSGHMKWPQESNGSSMGVKTWLAVLTSERFLFLDHALFINAVDTQSIRHDCVQAVAATEGWVFGKIAVDIGSRTITVDLCPKSSVAPLAALANRWISLLEQGGRDAGAAASAAALNDIERLAELHAAGTLTDEEFASAKAKLLAAL